MKQKINTHVVSKKIKRIFATVRAHVLAVVIGCLALGAQAAVQVTQFDPPLQISAYNTPSENAYFNVLGTDFDADGEVDFHLASGFGVMSAFFNAPVRFAQHVAQPNVIGRGGPVAGVPLNSIIGTNIVSSIASNFYAWSSGYTNRDDLTQPLGDHEETVIVANLVSFNQPQGPTIIFTNGFVLTNIFYPHPIISGDVVGKDAVMALEFVANGQTHYGYIHFNFSGGAGGVIYGWAYETEPNVAIKAASLNPNQAPIVSQEHSGIIGVVDQGALPGWTVRVSTARGAFVTNVVTKAQGLFRVNLKPGAYRVQSEYVSQPGSGQSANLIIQRASKSVIVRRNHFTFIELGGGIGLQPLSETLR